MLLDSKLSKRQLEGRVEKEHKGSKVEAEVLFYPFQLSFRVKIQETEPDEYFNSEAKVVGESRN